MSNNLDALDLQLSNLFSDRGDRDNRLALLTSFLSHKPH
jgi:hypothetical protein